MNRIWQFGLFVWLGLVIVAAFLWAPLAKGLGEYTRVLYFHVPVAWVTVLAFLIGAVRVSRGAQGQQPAHTRFADRSTFPLKAWI